MERSVRFGKRRLAQMRTVVIHTVDEPRLIITNTAKITQLDVQQGAYVSRSILVANQKLQKIDLEIFAFKVFPQEIKN